MKIVAITSCPTGVAHTYMAAQKLVEGAKELGYDIKVEKQGALGIEDKLSAQDIKDADVVIFACDKKIEEEERFNGKKIYRVPVIDPIKHPTDTINNALVEGLVEIEEGFVENEKKINRSNKSLKQHILTGVSYIIPLVIAASVIMGIARIGASFYNVTNIWEDSYSEASGLLPFLHTLDGLGSMALGLMLPFLAGFISYSISDRPGLAAGFAGGLLAKEIEAGFFGALAAGLFAGYVTSYLVRHIKLKGALKSLGPVFLIPVLSVLITMLSVNYIIGVPFILLNEFLNNVLSGIDTSQAVFLAVILGAMVGFDLGGPVNKAAVLTALGLIEQNQFLPNTAVQVAIIIPTLGYGFATIISGKMFSNTFKEAGYASFIMGLVGISEGAIPFTLAKPLLLVPINMLGCAIGAAVAVGLGAINEIPISGFYGWFLVDKWWFYILGIIIGTIIVSAGALLATKSFKGDEVEQLI